MNNSNLELWEHQIIEVQFEIDVDTAKVELHKQKLRMIMNQLEVNNTKLLHLHKIIARRQKLNRLRGKKNE
jgi:hypothetical protein